MEKRNVGVLEQVILLSKIVDFSRGFFFFFLVKIDWVIGIKVEIPR